MFKPLSSARLSGLFLSISFALAAVGGAVPSAGDLSPDAIMQLAKTAVPDNFPDADTVLVHNKISTVYNKDGTDETVDDEYIKCLTDKGRIELSSFSFTYTKRTGEAAVEKVEIIDENGNVREVDFRKTLKEATDNESMAVNIYDPLDRKVSFAIPGLKTGEIRRVVRRTKLVKPRIPGSWSDINVLAGDFPVLSMIVQVDAPKDLPIANEALRREVKGSTTRFELECPGDPQRKRYIWKVENVPQVFPEPSMPALYTQIQHLRLSTHKNWKDVSSWYWNCCKPHLEATNEAMTNKVSEITDSLNTDEEKIRALFKFVSQEIRYMGLTFEDDAPGYAPHDVSITFDNRYGVCRDKAALLVEMLRIAGFEAYPVLISVGPKLDPDVPQPYFNHAIACVKKDGRYILMDPTNEATKDMFPAYLSNCSYLVAHPQGEPLLVSPVTPDEVNSVLINSAGTLFGDGTAVFKTQISTSGYCDNMFRRTFLDCAPAQRDHLLRTLVKRSVPDAELLSIKIAPEDLRNTGKPLQIALEFKTAGCIVPGETRDSAILPLLSKCFGITGRLLKGKTSLDKRLYDLKLSLTARTRETVRLDLDDSTKILSLPENAFVTNCPGYVFSREWSQLGNALSVSQTERIVDVEFPPERYALLKDAMKDSETAQRPKAWLVSKNAGKDAGHDIITHSSASIYHFSAPDSCVISNSWTKEILTYKGKGDNSEVYISYNPLFERVYGIEATVSNKDGRVSVLTDREINEMDSDTASRAPRYPSPHTIAVTLPGVEIGSTVSFRYAKHIIKSPVPVTVSSIFDAKDPVDSKYFELNFPETMMSGFVSKEFNGAPAGRIKKLPDGKIRYIWEDKDLPVLAKENAQPTDVAWRKIVKTRMGDKSQCAGDFLRALEEAAAKPSPACEAWAKNIKASDNDKTSKLIAIKKEFARSVRVSGPGVFALPAEKAVTNPDTVLSEGYGSPSDSANTLSKILRIARFDASVILADGSTRALPAVKESRKIFSIPYDIPLVRVRLDNKEYFLTPGDIYAPLECPDCEGASYVEYGGATGIVCGEKNRVMKNIDIAVRENGSVDCDFTQYVYGADAAIPIRKYSEILPVERDRAYRAILGALSENADAVRELETDTAGYPFKLSFSCHIPNYAVADEDSISLEIPMWGHAPFPNVDSGRKTPFMLNESDESIVTATITFPEGWTAADHLPGEFKFNAKSAKIFQTVSTATSNNLLRVTIRYSQTESNNETFDSSFWPLFKHWNATAASKDSKTLTVLKNKPASRKKGDE